jgi:hypothetical protein
MRVVQQAFETRAELGIAAILVDEQDARSDEAIAKVRPHVFVRMGFE